MQIFIMRHGEASYQNFSSDHTDALVPLTKAGESEGASIANWLMCTHSELLEANALDILVSPFLRAQQTCDIVIATLAKHLTHNTIKPRIVDFITPSGDAQQAHDYIDGLLNDTDYNKKAILLISHMPFVSFFVGKLTYSENMPIFATGAIAHINYDPKLMQGQLLGMMSPSNIKT